MKIEFFSRNGLSNIDKATANITEIFLVLLVGTPYIFAVYSVLVLFEIDLTIKLVPLIMITLILSYGIVTISYILARMLINFTIWIAKIIVKHSN